MFPLWFLTLFCALLVHKQVKFRRASRHPDFHHTVNRKWLCQSNGQHSLASSKILRKVIQITFGGRIEIFPLLRNAKFRLFRRSLNFIFAKIFFVAKFSVKIFIVAEIFAGNRQTLFLNSLTFLEKLCIDVFSEKIVQAATHICSRLSHIFVRTFGETHRKFSSFSFVFARYDFLKILKRNFCQHRLEGYSEPWIFR